MSDNNADRPTTTSANVPPSERVTDDVNSNVVDESAARPTPQADIAAEQAEASLDARDEAAAHDESVSHAEPVPLVEPADHQSAARERAEHEPVAHEPAAHEPVAYEPAEHEPVAHEPAAHEPAAYAPNAAQNAPVAPQQRAFTPPPVAPKKKGNRGIGALIAILSVIVFLVLFAIVAAIVIAVGAPSSVGETFMEFLASPVFYVPAIFFVIGFVLVVLLANRANWWAYILGSLFVAALVYFGTIAVGLVVNNVVLMTQAEAAADFARSASNPFIIAGALVAREVSMWIGAAISARGRRMKARNLTAREEYERAAAEHRAEYERGFAPA